MPDKADLLIDAAVLEEIERHGESAYPEEGAGLLLGSSAGGQKHVRAVVKLANTRESEARRNRYLLSAADYAGAEASAEQMGMDLLGVFHSHPDHPNQPSEFDREWAMPWFIYLITSIHNGRASGTRAWLLAEDRSKFIEQTIIVVKGEKDVTVLRTPPA